MTVKLPEHFHRSPGGTPEELKAFAKEHLTEQQFTEFYTLLGNILCDGVQKISSRTLEDAFEFVQF